MTEVTSKSQIDALGDRLRSGSRSEADLRALDSYRRTFESPYEMVTRLIREKLELDPTGRPAKSTRAIIEKLQRQTTRLSQIQDIAGCRIVVNNIPRQAIVVNRLENHFTGADYDDRRIEPRYGYRAIHIIPRVDEKPIEIQVRSQLQHLWAELSEKYADRYGQEIKYGGGKSAVRAILSELSALIEKYEIKESEGWAKIIKYNEFGSPETNLELNRLEGLIPIRDALEKFLKERISELK